MHAALREGRVVVRFFAEQDFLNGYFAVCVCLPVWVGGLPRMAGCLKGSLATR